MPILRNTGPSPGILYNKRYFLSSLLRRKKSAAPLWRSLAPGKSRIAIGTAYGRSVQRNKRL